MVYAEALNDLWVFLPSIPAWRDRSGIIKDFRPNARSGLQLASLTGHLFAHGGYSLNGSLRADVCACSICLAIVLFNTFFFRISIFDANSGPQVKFTVATYLSLMNQALAGPW